MNPLTLKAFRRRPTSRALAADATAQLAKHLDADALYRCYREEVYRYVSRRISRREKVEDITAEVFAAAAGFHAPPRYEPRLWLLGIARCRVYDALRRQKRRPETLFSELSSDEPPEPAGNPADEPEARWLHAENVRAVREIVATLKVEQREALLLQYVEGLSIAEIAVVMSRSPAAINSLLQRGRATLLRRGQEYFTTEEVDR